MKEKKRPLFAHSLPGKPVDDWQPLEEHLERVATMAKTFAECFASGEWAWNSGWLHDLGKTDPHFQAYLLRENGLDDSEHSSAGAAYADGQNKKTQTEDELSNRVFNNASLYYPSIEVSRLLINCIIYDFPPSCPPA